MVQGLAFSMHGQLAAKHRPHVHVQWSLSVDGWHSRAEVPVEAEVTLTQ
jgi:hypothetical protein